MTAPALSPTMVRPSRTTRRLIKDALSRPEISSLVMLVVVVAAFGVVAPQFVSGVNMRGLLNIIPELGLVALGVTILMIAGEFDLSVGSVFALGPMLAVVLMGEPSPWWLVETVGGPLPPWIAIAVGLCAGLVVGFLNGWITLTFRIPSFVTTLGMLFAARSLTVVLSGGFPPQFPTNVPADVFVAPLLGGDIRASLLWFVGFAVLLGAFLHKSNFGSWIYATGGQPQAAQDMGISTGRVKLICFMLCAFLASFAGLVQTFRLRATLPSAGTGLELEAIAAAVIGGSALAGGIGSVLGAVIGSILIRIIDNGLIMLRIDANWFKLAIGVLTVIAVILNILVRRTAMRMRA
jgi:simple sugar transport system permease protein